MRTAYLDHPGPIAMAHRGFDDTGRGLENSLPAFEAAVRLGYRYVETDVHATRDGVVVAFHDETLDRVTDRRGAIPELSFLPFRSGQRRSQRPRAAPSTRYTSMRARVDPTITAISETRGRLVCRRTTGSYTTSAP